MDKWAHIDIAGVMQSNGELPFLSKGMTGSAGVHQCICRTYITLLPVSFPGSHGSEASKHNCIICWFYTLLWNHSSMDTLGSNQCVL